MNTDMKKQTAVEFLGHELNVKLFYDISPELWEQVNEIFKQAKAMEKEQMKEMFCEGAKLLECPNELSARFEFAMYYSETYGGDK
jgi:hypothetical protein